MYAAPLQGGSRAVVLFNRHVATDSKFSSQNLTVFWKSIGLPPTEQVCRKGNMQRSVALRMHLTSKHFAWAGVAQAVVRDLFLRTDIGNFTSSYTGLVNTHSVLALKITPVRYSNSQVVVGLSIPMMHVSNCWAHCPAMCCGAVPGQYEELTAGGHGSATSPLAWTATRTT